MGFRIEYGSSALAYCLDHEHRIRRYSSVCALAQDADMLVFDAAYCDEDYPSFKGWGILLGRLDTKRLAPLTSKLWLYRVLIRVLWIQIWTRSRLKWNAWRARLSSQRSRRPTQFSVRDFKDQIRVLQPINYKGFRWKTQKLSRSSHRSSRSGTRRSFDAVGIMEQRHAQAGTIMLSQGDSDSHLLLLLNGEFSVFYKCRVN